MVDVENGDAQGDGEQIEQEAPTAPVEEAPKEPEAPPVPENYEAFTLPEGVELDEAMMGEFMPLAKELGLTQEMAQKLVDLQAKFMSQSAEAENDEWNDLTKQWEAMAKTDKEFGGDKLPQTLANVKAAVDKLGSSELREALEWSGMGNHPEMIRFFNRVYTQFLAEDRVEKVNQSPADDTPKTRGQKMFPGMQ